MTSSYYYRWASQKTYRDIHTDHKSFFVDKTRLSKDWVRPDADLETGQRGEDDELIQYHKMNAQQLGGSSTKSAIMIADLYYYGARGMPRDHVQSYQHYERAAATGDSNALAKIASMRLKGEGCAQNYTGNIYLLLTSILCSVPIYIISRLLLSRMIQRVSMV
jgi:TPR repeat protein